MGMELRIEDGVRPAQGPGRSTDSPQPAPPTSASRPRPWDHHPAHGLRPVGTRVERPADLRPMVFQPRPQLLRAHPVDAWGTGFLLDVSERLSEILAGQELLPQACRGGVRCGIARRLGWTSALNGSPQASPSDPPAQAPHGVGCLHRPSHEHERPASRLRVRPFPAITIPAGSTASADFSTASDALADAAVPHHPTNGARAPDGHPGTPVETSTGKTSNLPRAPTAST